MKAKLLLVSFISLFTLQSCTTDVVINEYQGNISLPELMESYDLWYVDYNMTTGNGDVPFLSKAFTVSFLGGDLFANNNLVGIGSTGNGFGVNIGYHNYTSNSIRVYHNIYGFYELEVYQISPNEIKLVDPYTNTAYYLISSNGNYNIQNVAGNYYTKKLNLYYNSNDYEGFNITVINDGRIRLYHLASGTTYEFVGRGFIPIMRNAAQRTKTNLASVSKVKK